MICVLEAKKGIYWRLEVIRSQQSELPSQNLLLFQQAIKTLFILLSSEHAEFPPEICLWFPPHCQLYIEDQEDRRRQNLDTLCQSQTLLRGSKRRVQLQSSMPGSRRNKTIVNKNTYANVSQLEH